ncbi:MAG: TonB-dependent receptor [Acidobacteria bacterium]|nr:TonB-dependent receptor [Acidobacteriota bacterium]
MGRTGVRLALVAGVMALLLPGAVSAQQTSGIAGLVRDASGAVLPGVTVEASSPALIEKMRTVVTDGEGRYNIVDLRPGTYTVTFTLPGFRGFRREGIELTSGFTATVNAELAVGTLTETITVSGESPLVDTQNVRRQNIVSNELLDVLPTSNKHINTVVTLTAGFTGLADVGGQYTCQIGGGCSTSEGFHGKAGSKVNIDGMGMENMAGVGNSSYQLNAAVVEELVLQTSGISADTNADGPVLNIIPKEGANIFSGSLLGVYSNDALESDNLTDELRARGLTTSNTTLAIWDKAVTLGGPIVRDRLWFFGAARAWGYRRIHAGVFWNETQDPSFALTPPGAQRIVVPFTPWVDRPLDGRSGRWQWTQSFLGRLTWQAAEKHKVNLTFDTQEACNCGSTSSAQAHEESFSYRFDPNRLYQVAWSSPLTDRLLFEAGAGGTISHWHQFRMPGVTPNHVMIRDVGRGSTSGARETYIGHPNDSDRYSERFSVSYVTGSHAFKTGFDMQQGVLNTFTQGQAGDVSYTFLNGVPIGVNQFATPYELQGRFNELGIYAQDQWKIDRLTLNLGLRFDYFNGWVPAQHIAATPSGWLPERTFDKVTGVPLWKDINPRLGAAYDLLGDGRTALKVSLGRYVRKTGVDIANENNPLTTSVNRVARAWTDANRNYVPDCDLGNFDANGECAAIANRNFGKNNPLATRWSDEVLSGWGVRDSNWDFSAELQRQVSSWLSVTGGYYRNNGGYYFYDSKTRVTDNLAVGPEDYDPYCITAPRDPRLPGGGGYQVCGLYDIKPEKFGLVDNLVTKASDYGKDKRINDFFSVNFTTRFAGGTQFGGGFDTGRSVKDRCFVVDSPEQLTFSRAVLVPGAPLPPIDFCHVVRPFKAQTQVKLYGSLPLPGDFVVSGAYQNLSGPEIVADYPASTTEIAPSLGRNLSGGVRSIVVPLLEPQKYFEDRVTRLDLRVSKIVRLTARLRVQLNADAYNALNSSSIRSGAAGGAINTTFGPRWRQPLQILDPRIFQFSALVSF